MYKTLQKSYFLLIWLAYFFSSKSFEIRFLAFQAFKLGGQCETFIFGDILGICLNGCWECNISLTDHDYSRHIPYLALNLRVTAIVCLCIYRTETGKNKLQWSLVFKQILKLYNRYRRDCFSLTKVELSSLKIYAIWSDACLLGW